MSQSSSELSDISMSDASVDNTSADSYENYRKAAKSATKDSSFGGTAIASSRYAKKSDSVSDAFGGSFKLFKRAGETSRCRGRG